jgi:acyl carrier protein
METKEKDILNHIRQAITKLFDIDEQLLMPDAKLYEDLDIDSIDAVDLLIELKKFTGKSIKPDTFKEVKTLQDIVIIISALDQP